MKTFEEISQIISSEVNQLKWNKKPVKLYEPIGYVLSLGGKRVRPALTLLACNMFADDIMPAVKPALGIEIFHNFTLLHDDIMDRADIRRGKPTVHKKWDDNTAILSGDMMQIIAYQFMTEAPEKYLKQVLDVFSVTAGEICEGQQFDMDFESRSNVSAEEYLEMIRLKTAVLLGCALKCGALIGGASAEDAQNLYDFGINIGLAFQLKDDLLDVYGNEATFGKKIGGDILCNKKTYLLIHALQLAKGEILEELNYWMQKSYQQPEEKIAAVSKIYNLLGVKKICEEKMNFYYERALANLQNVTVSVDKKHEITRLAMQLMYRED